MPEPFSTALAALIAWMTSHAPAAGTVVETATITDFTRRTINRGLKLFRKEANDYKKAEKLLKEKIRQQNKEIKANVQANKKLAKLNAKLVKENEKLKMQLDQLKSKRK